MDRAARTAQITRQMEKLERKLERLSQKLPVDTPLDKRRRRRNVERAETGGKIGAIVALLTGAAAYIVWRARRTVQPAETPAHAPGRARHTRNGEGSPQVTTPARG